MSIVRPQTAHIYCEHFDTTDEDSLLQPVSACPSCRLPFSLALILPCSHPICGPCVVAAGGKGKGSQTGLKTPGLKSCSVPCPCCRRAVELPCWSWTSAVSCLPEYPKLSPECTSAGRGAAPGQSGQKEVFNKQTTGVIAQDGDVDLLDAEMQQSVYGLHFALDSSHVPSQIHISNSSMTAAYRPQSQPGTTASPVSVLPMLRGDVVIRLGQYYWEVDVCNSALYRIGVVSRDNSRSWWFERRGFWFSAVYDDTSEPVCSVPPGIKTIGLFLNMSGGVLSFYNALSREHLVTLPTRFHPGGGVVPAFALGQGRLRIHTGLTPPPLVFCCKDSGYRGAQGVDRNVWRREVAFKSVRKVVEKFEELASSH